MRCFDRSLRQSLQNIEKHSEPGEIAISVEVKSCATKHCPTPPGPEGSNGQHIVLCDAGKLDLFCFSDVQLLQPSPVARTLLACKKR